jgi:phosphohistidine phosphatase
MNILLVRHAIAEDPAVFAMKHDDDNKRPLTSKGKKRMRAAAKGLSRLHPKIDYLISSPLLRAIQTANILHDFYPYASRQETIHLAPGATPERLAEYLGSLPADASIALIGHEPDLSQLIAWLCCGTNSSFVRFKKGAACLLNSVAKPAAGRAEMDWFLTPRQLRDLAI